MNPGAAPVTVSARWSSLPARIGATCDLVDQIRADLRERGDVTDFGDNDLRVVVYHAEEAEAVAADVLEKLAFLGLPVDTTVHWVDGVGGTHVRTFDSPVHPDTDSV